jgi:polyhydroxyalkanoate synthase subunit PhaC
VDFNEGGDLLVYTCEKQLAKMDEHIRRKGYLEGQSMVNSFNLLRSNDLIWTFIVNNYLLGKEPLPFDMLYWNTDALRMPGRMHVDYLRKMYLENRLIQPGGIRIDHVPVDLRKIDKPTFIMAAIDDHIAPWRAAYPLTGLVTGPTRFVLSGSGHVAGVINHPSREKYHYWRSDNLQETGDKWLEQAEIVPGSWWPEWREWLNEHISGQVKARLINPRRILESAPGSYALTMAD